MPRNSNPLPLRYLDDQILVTENDAWTCVKLGTVTYDFLSHEQRIGIASGLATALAGLPDADCHLVAVPRRMPIPEWATSLHRSSVHAHDGFKPYLRTVAKHLTGERFATKVVYLFIRLGSRRALGKVSVADGISQAAKDLGRQVNAFLGIADPTLSGREVAKWRSTAERIHRILASHQATRSRPARASEVRWLIQRTMWRGIRDPYAWDGDSRAWGKGDLQMLGQGVLHRDHHWTRIIQPQGTSYAAVLAFARFPVDMELPGHEWLSLFDILDHPVEISFRFKVVPPRKAAGDLSKKSKEALDQENNILMGGQEVPIHLDEIIAHARQLNHEVEKHQVTMIYGQPRLVTYARNPRDLATNVDLTIEAYRDIGIDLSWPSGDQLEMFLEAIPGASTRVKCFPQYQPVHTVTGAMPTATSELGDNRGPYIGYTTGQARSAVTFDLFRAAATNNPTVTTVTGQPGSGKTTLSLLLAYQAAARGAWVFFIDPKGEAGGLTTFADIGRTTLWDLAESEAGVLDPFALADDAEDAQLKAIEALRLLLPSGIDARTEQQLTTAVHLVATDPNETPSLMRVAALLAEDDHDDARRLGMQLNAISSYPIARLIMSPRSTTLDTEFAQGLTVIQMSGLTLPDAGVSRDEYSMPMRLSVAVMFLVAEYTRALAQMDRSHPKAVFMDEAWMLTSTPQGRQLIPALARMGRSRNTAVVLASQSATDFISDTVINNRSTAFCLRSTIRSEATAAMKLLGVHDTDYHAEVLNGLANGEAIFRDLNGRVGTLKVDLVDPGLARAFDSNPTRAVRRQPKATPKVQTAADPKRAAVPTLGGNQTPREVATASRTSTATDHRDDESGEGEVAVA